MESPHPRSNEPASSQRSSSRPAAHGNAVFTALLLLWVGCTAWLLLRALEFLWELLTKSAP